VSTQQLLLTVIVAVAIAVVASSWNISYPSDVEYSVKVLIAEIYRVSELGYGSSKVLILYFSKPVIIENSVMILPHSLFTVLPHGMRYLDTEYTVIKLPVVTHNVLELHGLAIIQLRCLEQGLVEVRAVRW